MSNISPYILYILIPIIAAFTCGMSIPKIITLAKRKKLYDLPDNLRKIHKEVVPNIGGVAIFFSYIIIASIFIRFNTLIGWNYIVAATMILFVVGIKDDIISLTPTKKFAAQILAAVITVVLADIRLHSLHGIMGVHELPTWFSIGFSIVGCIFVTNAFNLIDGIDGLAGSISVLCTGALGTFLAMQGNVGAAFMAFAMMGALIGFLKYNIPPARIFMGDSGSLVIGFTISILCIIFINSYNPTSVLSYFVHSQSSALTVALSILFIPVFDSFRVFVTRIAKGTHPFKADRTHLHHFLLDLGFSHSRTVTTLITVNLLIISVSLLVQDFNPNIAIAAILTLTFGLFGILYFMRRTHLSRTELPHIKSSSDQVIPAFGNSKETHKTRKVPLEASLRSIATEGQ
jgi:UDP-N-acetylmuramyl pentapeptide phosphotransferase/UDP-N-acetylglucosamine-1-phosphate transferase